MRKFRKKPVVIVAAQWFEAGELDCVETLGEQHDPAEPCHHCGKLKATHGRIETLEGEHIVCPGDWIIRGVQGEFYPCKPDIFEQTYDEVS